MANRVRLSYGCGRYHARAVFRRIGGVPGAGGQAFRARLPGTAARRPGRLISGSPNAGWCECRVAAARRQPDAGRIGLQHAAPDRVGPGRCGLPRERGAPGAGHLQLRRRCRQDGLSRRCLAAACSSSHGVLPRSASARSGLPPRPPFFWCSPADRRRPLPSRKGRSGQPALCATPRAKRLPALLFASAWPTAPRAMGFMTFLPFLLAGQRSFARHRRLCLDADLRGRRFR